MESILVIIIGILIFAFLVFYTYKQIEYIFVSVGLFRKMVQNQEDIVKLLLDIRDNTKVYRPILQDIPEIIKCPHCVATLKLTLADRQERKFNCPKCDKEVSI